MEAGNNVAACNRTSGKRERHSKTMPQLVKKDFLTSWWTGELAPPPLPPHHNLFELQSNSGHKLCKDAIFLRKNQHPWSPFTPPTTISTGYVGFFDSLRMRPVKAHPVCCRILGEMQVFAWEKTWTGRPRDFLDRAVTCVHAPQTGRAFARYTDEKPL
mgnify:CR=1 FL=1